MRKLFMLIMVVALVALPAMAQDWQSTSAMPGSGSAYSAQVTAVGAAEVTDMATTTDSYSPAKAPSGRRHLPGGTNEPGQSTDSPVGDAVLPLLLLACAYFIMRATRTRTRKG